MKFTFKNIKYIKRVLINELFRKRKAVWEHKKLNEAAKLIYLDQGCSGILELMHIVSMHNLKRRAVTLNKIATKSYIPDFDYWLPDSRPINSIEAAPWLAYRRFVSYESKLDYQVTIPLKSHCVLSFPWSINRLKGCMEFIGTDVGVTFREDTNNHYLTYFHPLSIAWAHNGLHSISTGIIKNEGIVSANEVYDMSHLYNDLLYDGFRWKYTPKSSNSTFSSPSANTQEYIGTLYEISRYILKDEWTIEKVLEAREPSCREHVLTALEKSYPEFINSLISTNKAFDSIFGARCF